ncbi:MAG TPA: YhjD/YihY/BrkB family envelope integrity protein [Solirubrobacterales bacterium]
MRPARAFDRLQQRHRALALPMAVGKKFHDDQGGNLSALIAYRAFFSLFPLLLLLTTIVGYVLAGDPERRRSAVDSVLAQLPAIGEQIQVRSLQGSGVALAVGIVGSLWAGLGVVLAAQEALNSVWGAKQGKGPGFLASRLRSLALLAALGTLALLSTAVSGLVGGGVLAGIWGVGVSLALNVLVFGALFVLLTSVPVAMRVLLPGIVVAAVGWAVLQVVGGYFVSHQIRDAGPAYGTFALVLGLLVWVQIGAMLTVLSAELNVVCERGLWPRSLLRAPTGRGGKRK